MLRSAIISGIKTHWNKLLYLLLVIAASSVAIFWLWKNNKQNLRPSSTQENQQQPINNNQSAPTSGSVSEPTLDFTKRVTLKPFGIYVTPQNSPIQPEKFTGYHTGADAEYGDITDDVKVHAIAPGKVLVSRTAQGYGGVMVIKHNLNNQSVLALYGHLRPSSMLPPNSVVDKNRQIAVLGTAYSSETDYERRHLHLGILKSDQVDLSGYVQNRSELANWFDPVQFLKQQF